MRKLIMIDDNPLEHFIAEKLLKQIGLFKEVQHFMGAKECIEYVEENLLNVEELPDAIILDLNMPGFNGHDFLESFNQFQPRLAKKVPVYILSSSVRQSDMMLPECYSFVRSYFIKPLNTNMLTSVYDQPQRLAANG